MPKSKSKQKTAARIRRWGSADVRALLRKVSVPGALEDDPVGLALRRSLRSASAADAVKSVVDRALERYPGLYANLIERIDLSPGTKHAVSEEVAAGLDLSVRTMYRYRAQALRAIGREIEAATSRGSDDVTGTVVCSAAASLVARGRYALKHPTLRSIDAAWSCFERALELEPSSASAHGGRGEVQFRLGEWMMREPRAAFAAAKGALAAGIACDPNLPELHATCALLEMFAHADLARARASVTRALSLASSSTTARHAAAVLALVQRNPCDAIAHLERVLDHEDDPLAVHTTLGVALRRSGDAVQGVRVLEDVVAVDESYAPARFALARILAGMRQYDRSREHLTALVAAEPRGAYVAALALVSGRMGDPSAARRYLGVRKADTVGWSSHYLRAYAYVGLDMKREAFTELTKADEGREPWVVMMEDDEFLAELGESRSLSGRASHTPANGSSPLTASTKLSR